MKRHVAFLVVTVVLSAHAGERVKRPPHMAGSHLIAELRGGPSALRLFDKPYALGYLAGVADATGNRRRPDGGQSLRRLMRALGG